MPEFPLWLLAAIIVALVPFLYWLNRYDPPGNRTFRADPPIATHGLHDIVVDTEAPEGRHLVVVRTRAEQGTFYTVSTFRRDSDGSGHSFTKGPFNGPVWLEIGQFGNLTEPCRYYLVDTAMPRAVPAPAATQ